MLVEKKLVTVLVVVCTIAFSCTALHMPKTETAAHPIDSQVNLNPGNNENLESSETSNSCPPFSNLDTPYRTINTLNLPAGACIAPNGDFAIGYWSIQKKFSMYSSFGQLIKTVDLPADSQRIIDCVYTKDMLLLSDSAAHKIFKYTHNGRYLGIFASGKPFVRLLFAFDSLLYVGVVSGSIDIYYVVDANNVQLLHSFPTGQEPRGMVMDPDNNLLVSMFMSKKIKKYDFYGNFLSEKDYEGATSLDGIDIDGRGNLYLANRKGPSTVAVLDTSGSLTNTIHGFKSAIDVAVDQFQCKLLVVDFSSNKVLIYY